MGVNPFRRVRAHVARQRITAIVDGIETMPQPARAVVLVALGAAVAVIFVLALYGLVIAEILRSIRAAR